MRISAVIGLIVAIVLGVLAVRTVPEWRLRSGLESAGIPRPVARCMAGRMVRRLSYAQLWKLADLPGAHGAESRKAFLHNVRALGDPQINGVTVSSFAICGIGSLF